MKSWNNVLVVFALFCFLPGCSRNRDLVVPSPSPARQNQSVSSASNPDLIVLLPDPDGKVGTIQVITKGGSQTLDKSGYATLVEGVATPPTVPKPMIDSEITGVFGQALSAQPDLKGRFAPFILYFESNTTKLTDKSKDVLPEIVGAIKNRKASEIYLVGHTDRLGTEAYNLELSSRRATYVRDLLISSGVPSSALIVSYHGESMPAVYTEDEVWEPRNRRVEVFVK